MKVKNKIEIRSEEVQDILQRPPNWIIRWGITVLFFIVAVLIVGSYFYKYPEIIQSTIVINTENMPATVFAKSTGKIDEIFVKDKQIVEKSTALAIIENNAKYSDIQLLSSILDTIKLQLQNNDTIRCSIPDNLVLGEVLPNYITFLNALKDYQIYKDTKFLTKKVKALKKQKNQYLSLYKKLKSQTVIYGQQLKIVNNQLDRDSSLLITNAISKSEWEKSKNSYLQTKLSYENSKVSTDNTKITIAQLEQNLLEINQQNYEKEKEVKLTLETAIDNLENQINNWKKLFVLETPIKGKVTFTQIWSKNQNVMAGKEVFSIVPTEESKILGKIKLPIKGAGKVKENQTVNIKLDNYPYLEYGFIVARIKSVSLMPSENFYSVEVEFPQGLITNYNKKLSFGQDMQGSAEIITEDIRLLERFIQPLKYILKK